MCGYVGRVLDNPKLQALFHLFGLDELLDPFLEGAQGADIEHFYPAFGGDSKRVIRGVIIEEQGSYQLIDPTWWFDCQAGIESESLSVGKLTTFNARNLHSPYWKNAIQHHRAIIIATQLGESKWIDKKKQQFLVKGEPFLLGAVYRKHANGQYSCAIITRDSHPRFEAYHDKAFPLFLPQDPEFIQLWLDQGVAQHPRIEQLLAHPRIVQNLEVVRVKSFKSAKEMGETVCLEADGS